MKIYFAPMEGVTDAGFRRVHHECFGGIDKYFTPFISPGASASITAREKWELLPATNGGAPVVPQLLCRDAENTVAMCVRLADMGYAEVNLNLGCPSATVVTKGRGSAQLRDIDALKRFLDGVCENAPIPVSIKTRIGFSDPAEWDRLLALYKQYPVHELIVHYRTRTEFYSGTVHRELIPDALPFPAAFNGDLFTVQDVQSLLEAHPNVDAIMLGRGALTNPALPRLLRGGNPLTIGEIATFHDRLYRLYLQTWPETGVIGRMHCFITYLAKAFDGAASKKLVKAALRATTRDAYDDAIYNLFHGCTLKEVPAFES